MSPDGPNTMKAGVAAGPETQRTHTHGSAGLSGNQARGCGPTDRDLEQTTLRRPVHVRELLVRDPLVQAARACRAGKPRRRTWRS
jgi:hypothetical protein